MKTFRCGAVLFDLDGVLVDSGAVVVRTWREWSRRHGLDPEHTVEFAHGRPAREVVEQLAPHLDATAETAELERIEVEALNGVEEIEGARELLRSLPAGSWTVVTSGTRPLARGRLEHLGLAVPEHLVTASDVERGKPHPEPYLKAASLLGVAPQACVVVEDAPSGIAAARAAGMRVIAVATTYPLESLSEADTIAPTLERIRASHSTRDGSRVELQVESE